MSYRVIVVDDDPDFLESIQRGLIISGYKNVTAYQDPLAAANTIENSEPFDVALIDINMPGMDGVTLLEIIKTNHPYTECIVLTAVDDIRMAVKCLKKGAYDYLVKPISNEDLKVSMHRALEKKHLVDVANISKNRT